MSISSRPRRSFLYMPGSNARALDKGRRLAADALIMDLEDSIAPNAKTESRTTITVELGKGGYGRREILVRINALDTDWGRDDIAAIARTSADAILVPKVSSVSDVLSVDSAMAAAGAPDGMAIWCMIESPMAILNIREIAAASPRLGGFVMGTSDLVKDLGALHTTERLPLVTSLGMTVLAARAHGLAIIDGVHLDLDDDAGFKASCRQGREFGFDGKSLIHPKTLAAANAVFGPTENDISHARKVIDAFDAAIADGKGVAVLDGKLIENLHAETARQVLALAENIAALDADVAA
ncbi:MAG: CoA ester lyase [Alphaproteobacteria bacterium]